MSELRAGWYILRDQAGDCYIAAQPLLPNAYFDGKVLCGPLTPKTLADAALLGLSITPREGETCKDCKLFLPDRPDKFYAVCPLSGLCINELTPPCADFRRKEQP